MKKLLPFILLFTAFAALAGTTTSDQFSGQYVGNANGLTNVISIGSPSSLSQVGRTITSQPVFIDNNTLSPWIPWAKVLQKATTNIATVCVVGDSYAVNNATYSSWPRHFIQNLWGLYGCSGMALQPVVGNGNGNINPLQASPYTNYWWGCSGYSDAPINDTLDFWSYWAPSGIGNVSAGGTIQLGQGANMPVNQLTLYWIAQPIGGAITLVEVFNQGNYNTTNMFNGFAATPTFRSATIAIPTFSYYGFFATNNNAGTTNVILGCKYWNTNMNGFVYCDMGGNYGAWSHLTLAQMNAVPTNLLTQFFAAISPDIVIYSKLDYGDPGAQTPTQMYTNVQNIVNCFPIGTPIEFALNWMNPNYGQNEISSGMTTNNAILTSIAVSNNDYVIDLASQFPNYASNTNAGLALAGDVNAHPTWYGACSLASAAARLCHIPITSSLGIMDTGIGSIQAGLPFEVIGNPANNNGGPLYQNGSSFHLTNVPTATGSNWMFYIGN